MATAGLPTRLLRWSSSILEAVSNAIEANQLIQKLDDNGLSLNTGELLEANPVFYILNAYRLNQQACSTLSHPELFSEDELEVVLRCFQASNLYIEDVLASALRSHTICLDQKCLQVIDILEGEDKAAAADFIRSLSSPIAVRSKNGSLYTLHGGKVKYYDISRNPELLNKNFTRSKDTRTSGGWTFINSPTDLHQLNNQMQASRFNQFMKKFVISAKAIHRIRTELERLGISPKRTRIGLTAHQPAYHKWALRGIERYTLSFPHLEGALGEREPLGELYDGADYDEISDMVNSLVDNKRQ
ncbi:hypothetical protein [Flexibacterium corallicola]|uniref:hypothetical protein n=1 Tax=Flexibacterium corallicola TaxID=3037259 RepID=UPI00286F4744|nr:hypothetical protein [Pseudovibrio sp. M1P-2-3]